MPWSALELGLNQLDIPSLDCKLRASDVKKEEYQFLCFFKNRLYFLGQI